MRTESQVLWRPLLPPKRSMSGLKLFSGGSIKVNSTHIHQNFALLVKARMAAHPNSHTASVFNFHLSLSLFPSVPQTTLLSDPNCNEHFRRLRQNLSNFVGGVLGLLAKARGLYFL